MAKSVYFTAAIHAHYAVDETSSRYRSDCKQITGMHLYSNILGLKGRADVVEWKDDIPIPVETKTGELREFENFSIQIGLQALCLEEMFNLTVPYGEIFFTKTRRRNRINVDSCLKDKCISTVSSLREAFLSHDVKSFPRINDHRCPQCQYIESCLPSCLN